MLTTAQAAALAGMSTDAFRREMSRERQRGRDYRLPGPDARTPLWDEAGVREWAARRRHLTTKEAPAPRGERARGGLG